LNKWFHIFSVFFRLFLWFRRLRTTLFVLISRLCAVCFLFPVLVRCLFDSGWKISFEQVQIRSMTMTLASSTLQIWIHKYSHVSRICRHSTLPFHAINMDVVSLFTNSSFLFLANLDLYCINVLYQFEWMSIVYFFKKKNMYFFIQSTSRKKPWMVIIVLDKRRFFLAKTKGRLARHYESLKLLSVVVNCIKSYVIIYIWTQFW